MFNNLRSKFGKTGLAYTNENTTFHRYTDRD